MQKAPTPKKARFLKGYTQEKTAYVAGVSLATVVRAEKSGKWPAQSRVLTAYRSALGLPVTP